MKYLKPALCSTFVGILTTVGASVQADVIYDSYSGYNGSAFTMANGQEIGNQISLSSSTWALTNFAIEYFTPNTTFSGSVGIDVRFYKNDGVTNNGFATPGTVFYDSGWFYGLSAGSNYWSVTYNSSDLASGTVPLTISLPSTFTFSVTFTNLLGGNTIEMPLANSTSNGIVQTFGDYWLNSGGTWPLLTNTSPANLTVSAAGTVPEPSTIGLTAIGSVLLLGINKLRRKS